MMPTVSPTGPDTIRILVSTDNHVGYNEHDPVRGDDSWRTFDEIMQLARTRDVDMVLLAGDLFHENKPSRKSLYQVMRSLRENCYSDKPCELELLSDAKDNFAGAFAHANYQDPDINVGIPVFSIHGNHDDPSGEGHLAALDVLQVAGLLNYYGRTPESDNIQVKPVLLQKGQTKLALYGLSNVRDQRLFRTFRDGKVRFFRPSESQDEWFNLISVHQNHHAYNETGYLPERFLPEFLDLVIWGHEHECLMTPRMNPERRFHVMQPGSSIATSLVPGEAAQKQVALLTITGRKFLVEPIPLKTVRPFIMREISLSEEKSLKRVARRDNNRTEVTKLLISIVDEMIEEANAEWMGMQRDEDLAGEGHPPLTPPLPLIRLRVEVSTPSGGAFDCENPQRFSNRFVGRVANVNDVVQFHRKKRAGQVAKASDLIEQPDAESISHLTALDSVKVEKLVREYLQAQSLTILPENTFSDAVSQFVDKDDKHAVEIFLNEALQSHSKHLLSLDAQGDIDANAGDVEEHLNISDDDTHLDGTSRVSVIEMELAKHRAQMEEQFARSDAAGVPRQEQSAASRRRYKPKPDGWDTDFDGVWEDQPGALLLSGDDSGNEPEAARALPPPTTRARGRGGRGVRGGRGGATTAATRGRARTTAGATRATRQAAASGVDMNDEDGEQSFAAGRRKGSHRTAPSRAGRASRAVASPESQIISSDEGNGSVNPPDADSNNNDDDVMLDAEFSPDEDDHDDEDLFVAAESQPPVRKTTRVIPPATTKKTMAKTTTSRAARSVASARNAKPAVVTAATATTRTGRRAAPAAAPSQQSILAFTRASQGPGRAAARPSRTGPFEELDDDDDDDAFDAAPLSTLKRR